MSPQEIPYLSIKEASTLIRLKKLSPVELVRAVLARIDRIEPKVHAFVTLLAENALLAAQAAEREIARKKYRGPLHGIPVGVKDTHYTKGIKTTAATPALADFVPSFDATVVERLKDAGAILLGGRTLFIAVCFPDPRWLVRPWCRRGLASAPREILPGLF